MGDLILTSLVKRCGPRGRWHSKLAPRRHFVSAQNPTPSRMEPRTHGVTVRLYNIYIYGRGGLQNSTHTETDLVKPEPSCLAQGVGNQKP